MKNMFKKTLVAAALAGLSANAFAAEIDATAAAVVTSTQYLNTAEDGTFDLADSFTVEVGANYTQNDTITLTFSGAELEDADFPASISSEANGAIAAGRLTLGRISVTAEDGSTVVVYRVTDVEGDTFDGNDGAVLRIPALTLDAQSALDNNGVSVSFAAETNTGLNLDTGGGDARSADLVTVANEYATFSVDGDNSLNAVINVAEDREEFIDEASNSVWIDETSVDGDFTVAATDGVTFTGGYTTVITSSDYELTGTQDFGFLSFDEEGDYDATGDSTVTIDCGAGAGTNVEDLVVTTSSISWTCDSDSRDVNVLFEVDGETVLEPQSFTLGVVVNYEGEDDNTGTVSLSVDAGEWSLNGSQVNISYIPYRHDISQVINLTNRSGQTGAVSVRAFPQGGGDPINLGEVATANANSMTTLAGSIVDALTEETGVNHRTASSIARYALEITTNAPAGAVEVYSAYNVGGTGARLVVNDSNGGGLSKSDD